MSKFQADAQEQMVPYMARNKSQLHNAPHYLTVLCVGLPHNDSVVSSDTSIADKGVDRNHGSFVYLEGYERTRHSNSLLCRLMLIRQELVQQKLISNSFLCYKFQLVSEVNIFSPNTRSTPEYNTEQ
jgi:hypothetical protein